MVYRTSDEVVAEKTHMFEYSKMGMNNKHAKMLSAPRLLGVSSSSSH